jgi:hypothetical protein
MELPGGGKIRPSFVLSISRFSRLGVTIMDLELDMGEEFISSVRILSINALLSTLTLLSRAITGNISGAGVLLRPDVSIAEITGSALSSEKTPDR